MDYREGDWLEAKCFYGSPEVESSWSAGMHVANASCQISDFRWHLAEEISGVNLL
jgi:hypothetical protein